jgi:NAD(P)-dependent dehydrogenase (short-subunit alcohol dehydrogenase family)
MDLGLKHKRALVTGSTADIGFAIAKQLAHEGAFVYVNGRTDERVNKPSVTRSKAKWTASQPTSPQETAQKNSSPEPKTSIS